MNLWHTVRPKALLALCTLFLVLPFGCERQGRSEVAGIPPSFAELAARVTPAVVNISTTSTVTVPGNPFRHFLGPEDDSPLGEFLKRFRDLPDREMKQQSLGSGIIVTRDGYIVTNNHMVQGSEEIKVKISDGRELKARVVGRDAKTDLALLKISTRFQDLPVLTLGDSDRMRVGDWVLAVGNPFGLEHTVTQGIISATGRVIGSGPYDSFLQTDTPINPGNSGGPLVNLKGEVVGITTAIVSGGQGIGFAIPSTLAKRVIAQLQARGRVVRGWIGAGVQNVTPEIARSFNLKEAKGALVGEVEPGSPAQHAGIRQGDVISAFAGKHVNDGGELTRLVAETAVGERVTVLVVRDGLELGKTLVVRELREEQEKPKPHPAAGVGSGPGLRVAELTESLREHSGIEEQSGVAVVELEPGGRAEEAGVQLGDLVLEVNRKPVRTLVEYQAALREAPSGEPLLLLLKRSGKTLYASLEPEAQAEPEK
ncbi:peptidase [Geomonas limicola]|uniref:Probable periplasmic serine endoprotease DegP-like n=1 Tax=Geomonas limicola TaxID=2740186 RepID=A0A6V8NCT6_9BACT|nr:Do family serine endopeptidase [Geomonas limicola]GFO70346.1 peptidase [Geomonas limicola]